MSEPSLPLSRRRRLRPLAALSGLALVVTAALIPTAAANAAETDLGFESANSWSATTFDGRNASPASVATSADAHSGAAALRLDLDTAITSDAGWVSASRGLGDVTIDSLAFWVKAQNASGLGVQLVDSTGQTHQTFLPLAATPDWQRVVLESPDAQQDGAWGGAGDGVWHDPAVQLSFVLNAFQRADTTATTASLLIDDIAAITADDTSLTLTSTTVGNVFVPGRSTTFGYTTDGDELRWAVTDVDGQTVSSGTQAVTSRSGELGIPDPDLGWYSLSVDAVRGGSVFAHADTTFARVADPEAVDENGRFAAATHYGQDWDPASLPLLATGGFPQLRDEVYWNQVETSPGVYDWSRARAEFLDPAASRGVRPLLLAGYGNPLYDDGNGPKSPEAVAAYSAYAAAMASEFGDRASAIEVWNEWDLGLGGNTNTSAADYVNLLRSASPAIKAAAPGLPVIGPAVADLNTSWLEDAFKLGALDYVDGIVLHPYSYPAGAEALDTRIEQLDALVKKYNGGVSKPLWITEHGWPTGTDARAISESSQAANIAKSAVIVAMNDVERYYVYDFVDDGVDASETEENFGLLHHPGSTLGAFTPKPSYAAYSTAAHQLSGASFAGRDTGLADVWDVAFSTPQGPLRVLWSTSPQVVDVPVAGPVEVVGAYGASHTVEAGSGSRLTLSLGDEPVYLRGDVDAPVVSATSLTLDPAFVGQPVSAHWTMDNTAGAADRTFSLRFTDGTEVTQAVASGASATLDFELPAATEAGTLRVTADVESDAGRIGRLTASTTVSEPLTLTGGHAIDDRGVSVLRLRVGNAGNDAVTVQGLTYSLGSQSGSAIDEAPLAAASTVEADVPLTALTGPTEWTAMVTVDGRQLNASGTVTPLDVAASTPVAHRTIEIDGALDDLDGLPSIDLARQGDDETVGSTGPADLSGTVWYTWDDDNLYLSADIADDLHDQPSQGSTIWQGDSIQFTVAAGAPGEATAWNEIGVALTASGPQLYRWLSVSDGAGIVPGARVAITRDDDAGRTVYEVAVPWSRLGGVTPGSGLVSSSLLVNEADGAGRAGYLGWGSGIATEKDSALFNALRLLPAEDDGAGGQPGAGGSEPGGGQGTGGGAGGSGGTGTAPAGEGLLAMTGPSQVGALAGAALLVLVLGGLLVARRRAVG